MIKVGSDFSGVGAFDFALGRITPFETVFACDWDKYARQSYIANHGEPKYYPSDVYDREIPLESLDIYMTSPPCQSFSLAGKREGKNSDKGILFFNSHEFIQKNKPRFFIFENVKGLLSDDEGKTFQEWVNMLGGKSVNGLPILFPYDNSVPYHLYWQVLNSKKHGVPQNRERVFLVGIRDDEDNQFQFPKEEHLTKRLKDVLEEEVFEKYFLSDDCIKRLVNDSDGYHSEVRTEESIASTICASDYKLARGMNVLKVKSNLDKYYLSKKMLELLTFEKKGSVEIANINKGGQKGSVASSEGKYIGCLSATDYKLPKLIQVKSATSKGYETATENDSINFSVPNSETRRGRVGKEVAQTLDTQCNQGVIDQYKIRRLTPRECFRLQDFPDTFKFVVSDSQLYKQAGNSITVRVLEKILRNLKL